MSGVRASSKTKKSPKLPRWRLVLLLLSLLGFTIFFLPTFGGILNLANLAAMGGFLLLAAVFLWWPAVLRLLKWFWSRRWGRILLTVSGLGLLALTVLLLVLCCEITAKLRAVPEEPCPTVVVLGCQVRGSAPSLLLYYRIEAAADYLREHPEAAAILSGGRGSGEDISEAACMYDGLVRRGVDPARLYLEDRSTTTQENLRFSGELMEREGLSGPVAVVSNDFHIFRALRMAQDQGLPAQGLAARSNWYSRPTYILREALAMIYYMFTS